MGLRHHDERMTVSSRLSILGCHGISDAVTLAAAAQIGPGKQEGEPFDRRQPEHVTLAGSIGLGLYDADKIEYRLSKFDPAKRAWAKGTASQFA